MPVLAASRPRAPFAILWRAFFAQFFSSETATSDIQLRQAIIGVLAFLVTPGILLAIEMYPRYQLALRFAPQTADGIFILLTSVFVTYSGVTIGLIAVFVWDALSFDRRDAMILGPLPLRGSTILGAKLAALGLFLLGTTVITNILSAIPFAMVIADDAGASTAFRAFGAHMIATVSAAVFVFSALVTLRGSMGLLGARTSEAGATILQFGFVAGLLSFVVVVLRSVSVRDSSGLTIVEWLPTFWFVALFERLRGPARPAFDALWPKAVWTTAALLVAAVLTSMAGYRREVRHALVPASRPRGASASARVSRAFARLLCRRDQLSRATADFIMLTLVRGRPQQMLIAINAAIAAPILAASLSARGITLGSLMQPRTIVLWIPLVVVYWIAIGVRASLFLPSELPASWTFAVNAPEQSRSYRDATRASMLALLVPICAVVTVVTAPLLGWQVAVCHSVFVLLLTTALVETLLMTVAHIPFTRAYPPGHTRLKTRWPLYGLGFLAFAYGPARLELVALRNARSSGTLVAFTAAALAILMWFSVRFAKEWPAHAGEDSNADDGTLAVLGLSQTVRPTR